jgi:RNA 3'-terminal phosphate cyclase (ATP)
MGPKVKLELERYGFYPAGGGRFVVEITPTDVFETDESGGAGRDHDKTSHRLVANLSYHIAKRELDTVGKLTELGRRVIALRGHKEFS